MATPTPVHRIDVERYGTNEIGQPRHVEAGCYQRVDTYTSKSSGEAFRERRHCAGAHDYSAAFISVTNLGLRPEFPGEGKYDSRCSCCYLGFSHTVNKHNAAIGLPLVS